MSEVKGHGIQKDITQQWRGQEYSIDLLPMVMVMAVVNDAEVYDAIDAICKAARTEMIGDGKIFVSDVEQTVRIRTGEAGTDAIWPAGGAPGAEAVDIPGTCGTTAKKADAPASAFLEAVAGPSLRPRRLSYGPSMETPCQVRGPSRLSLPRTAHGTVAPCAPVVTG